MPTTTDRTEHRAIMRACLKQKTPGRARDQLRSRKVSREKITRAFEELEQAGIGPDSKLLTVNQAAVVLGVIPRRVRLLCQEGRLGAQIGGGPWIIQRDELIEFMARDHQSGQAGRKAAQADKQQAADRWAMS